ncbi:MAG: NAD(P)/FAD-dependent oxidoreductase [Tepidisphaeraceae bacterium]
MNHLHVKYLLAGGGLAASSAALAIRKLDAEGSILLIGQEAVRPYHRPPLSKQFLRREQGQEELFAAPPGQYSKLQIDLRTGRRVAHLDTPRRAVMLDDGQEVAYDKLLIATGASPRHLTIPGNHWPNVFYLRTIADTERLQHTIDQVKKEGRPHANGRGRGTVIGGGVLGVEVAASLTQLGLGVDLVIAPAHPWEKFAGEATGRFVAKYLENRGVTIHANARPQKLEGDGRAQRVLLDNDWQIECDFVVAAVGAVANMQLLRGTPIAAEKAILVDDACRTNIEDIYAAGDVAAVFDPLFGKHRILDHWDNAQVTGTLAGRNMAGAGEHYDTVNLFFTDVFELSANIWGEARFVDRRLVRGTPNLDAPDFVEIGVGADGRVAQVIAVGHTGEDEALKDLVRRRVQTAEKEEALKDPARPLSEFLA